MAEVDVCLPSDSTGDYDRQVRAIKQIADALEVHAHDRFSEGNGKGYMALHFALAELAASINELSYSGLEQTNPKLAVQQYIRQWQAHNNS